MKKLILSVLLLPVIGFSEVVTVEKPVVCDKRDVVFNTLIIGDYKEVPVWVGKDARSNYTLFVNETTKTWTFLQFTEKVACILGSGELSRNLGSKVKSNV